MLSVLEEKEETFAMVSRQPRLFCIYSPSLKHRNMKFAYDYLLSQCLLMITQ